MDPASLSFLGLLFLSRHTKSSNSALIMYKVVFFFRVRFFQINCRPVESKRIVGSSYRASVWMSRRVVFSLVQPESNTLTSCKRKLAASWFLIQSKRACRTDSESCAGHAVQEEDVVGCIWLSLSLQGRRTWRSLKLKDFKYLNKLEKVEMVEDY